MITPRARWGAARIRAWAALACASAFCAASAHAPTPARAEAEVRGSVENVCIEARDSSLEEVLAGLADALNLQHRASAKLDKRISGTYEGPLQSVLKRILYGYDFVVKTEGRGIEVTVVGPSAGVSLATASAVRASQRTADADAATPRLTPVVVEPDAPVSAVAPRPPPVVAAAERRTRSSRAHSISRRHGDYAVAAAQEEHQKQSSLPRKSRSAGHGWREASSHVRHKRFAHRDIYCCGRQRAGDLMVLYPVRPL